MLQKYHVFGVTGTKGFCFDDTRTVQEFVEALFCEYNYYEPFGMEFVTIFQGHSDRGYCGWFTTDKSKRCSEEITHPNDLCIAYNVPGVFYYAEGGWGHHMISLGNSPSLDNPVSLHLRFRDNDNEHFDNTVVIAGQYTFRDIISCLIEYDYSLFNQKQIIIHSCNPYREPYSISFDDALLKAPLVDFKKTLPNAVVIIEIK